MVDRVPPQAYSAVVRTCPASRAELMPKPVNFALSLIAAIGSSLSVAETPDRVLSLAHPAVKWLLQVELPNAVEQYNHYKEGAGSYAYGQTTDRRKLFSMAIHRYPGATDAKSCRDLELQNIRENPLFASHRIDASESGESAYLRTSGTTQIEGRSIYGQHVHGFVFRDGLCAKVHVSSTLDDSNVASALMQAVETLSLKNATGEIMRSFHVSPRATLTLVMPTHWGFQTSNPLAGPARTLTMRTPDGHFQFMVTVFLPSPEQTAPAEAVLKKSVEASRDRAASEAAQTQIDIRPLSGRSTAGYFFFVTDKNLVGKPAVTNNWKHMRQGMLTTGAAFATFTVFSNDEDSPDALRAMRTLEGMAFTAE